MEELLTTEEAYVLSLDRLTEHFAGPIRDAGLLSTAEYSTVFGQLPQICNFHHQLYDELNSEWAAAPSGMRHEMRFGEILLRFAPYLKLYKPYTTGFTSMLQVLESYEASAAVQKLIRAGEQLCQQTLHSLLIRPVQRIPRYKLLVQRLHELTPPSVGAEHASLATVLETLGTILHHINDTSRHHHARERVIHLQQRLQTVDAAALSGPHAESLMHCSPSGWQERALLESLVAPHRQVVLEGKADEMWVAPTAVGGGMVGMGGQRGELHRTERRLILLSDVLLRVVEPPASESGGAAPTPGVPGVEEPPLFLTGALRAPVGTESVVVEAMDRKSLVADFSKALRRRDDDGSSGLPSSVDRLHDAKIWQLAGDFTTRVSIDGDRKQTCYLAFPDAASQGRWADALKGWGRKAVAMAAAASSQAAQSEIGAHLSTAMASSGGHAAEAELEGWLSYEGPRQDAGGWETRWFVIRSHYLLVFNTPASYSAEPLMIIDLTKAALRSKPKQHRRAAPHAWRIDVLEDSAVSGSLQLTKLILSAGPEPAARDVWLLKLEAAGCHVVG
jgi:hypothetical protein